MLIQEVVAIKPQLPQTAAQARIAVLKKGVDRAQIAVKAERKRQLAQFKLGTARGFVDPVRFHQSAL